MKTKLFYALFVVAVLCAACKPEEPKPTTGTVDGHEWVDLGLPSGTKWATCNVGADTPEAYGDYFAWGETATKDNFSWENYKYGSYWNNLTKYCTNSEYGIVDNKTQLEAADDAATVNWGAAWCTPTDEQWTELREKCTWTWTAVNEINGYRVTSNTTGNSIFLPAGVFSEGLGAYGTYLSSSLNERYPYNAWYMSVDSDEVDHYCSNRLSGSSVRPVLKQ